MRKLYSSYGLDARDRMLEDSEAMKLPILCATIRQKEIMWNYAKQIGKEIPMPISVDCIEGYSGRVLVYNADEVLRNILIEIFHISPEEMSFTIGG